MKEHEESARRLREALIENGLSQQELADRSGINKASISQYMNGTHIPGNKTSGAIGKVLGVRPQWLMTLDNIKYEKDEIEMTSNDKEILKMISNLSEDKKKMLRKMIEAMIEG